MTELAMTRDNELREVLKDADAIIVDHQEIEEALELVDDDIDVFAPKAVSDLGFDLIKDGEVVTQVGMAGVKQSGKVVTLWKEPGHGLVCEKTAPSPTTELEKWEQRQKEGSGDMTIDPVANGLDAETLRAVQKLIHGSPETFPELPMKKLTEAQEAYGMQASLMATLSKWVNEIENTNSPLKGGHNRREQ